MQKPLDCRLRRPVVATTDGAVETLLCSHNRKAALHGTVGSRETASILQGCVLLMGYKET